MDFAKKIEVIINLSDGVMMPFTPTPASIDYVWNLLSDKQKGKSDEQKDDEKIARRSAAENTYVEFCKLINCNPRDKGAAMTNDELQLCINHLEFIDIPKNSNYTSKVVGTDSTREQKLLAKLSNKLQIPINSRTGVNFTKLVNALKALNV